ncbi:DUF7882 family protein (plasmid) [Coraliomargarita sp. W4R53]
MPDRVLAHLKVVVATKLRRNESFTVSWRHPKDRAPGRSTIWMHASIPLRFMFDAEEAEVLDPEILNDFAKQATSSLGLTIDLNEPAHHLAPVPRRAEIEEAA